MANQTEDSGCDSFTAATGYEAMHYGAGFGLDENGFLAVNEEQGTENVSAPELEAAAAGAAAAAASKAAANADFERVVTSLATRTLAPHARLNSALLDEHQFYTAEVNMFFEGSLQELFEGTKQPYLKLSSDCRAFERPGAIDKKMERTQYHFQGDIDLISYRSTFPVSIGLVANEKLRGAENSTVHSSAGIKCSYISFPEAKESFRTNPIRIAHASIGYHDQDYMEKYPGYLDAASIAASVTRSPFNENTALIKIGSPVYDTINEVRKKMREAGDANVKDLEVDSEFNKLSGYTLAGKVEAGKAAIMMQKAVMKKIQYVPLYDAFEFKLVRAFPTQASESGVVDEKAAWADLTEKKTTEVSGEASEPTDKYMKRVRTIHASFLVRYRPVKNDAK